MSVLESTVELVVVYSVRVIDVNVYGGGLLLLRVAGALLLEGDRIAHGEGKDKVGE